jgi:ketosteroid isomerase-like protein
MHRLVAGGVFVMSIATMGLSADAQTTAENEILRLSRDKFRWKTEGQIDRLAELFDDELAFVHITGHISSKDEWIGELRSRRFVYNTIDVERASANVYGDTAVLVGRAAFKVTIRGGKGTYDLVYTEVYAKKNGRWKLVNLHTCSGG